MGTTLVAQSGRGSVIAASDAPTAGQAKLRVRLIGGDIQGSSAYFPAPVIERDGPKVFPVKTHMHLDHQSFFEFFEKPEGSLKDFAAVIDSTPVYERDNPMGEGLYADVRVFSQHAQMIKEMAPYIGVSIRAIALSEEGESPATGEMTDIVTELVQSVSVDFVTHDGADGKIIQIMESARKDSALPPGAKEVKIEPTLTGESAGSKEKGVVKMDQETANKLLTAMEAMNTNFTNLAAAITAQSAAPAGKANEDGEPLDLNKIVREAVSQLAGSDLPKASQEKVLEVVENSGGKVKLSDAIEAEKTYLTSLGIRLGTGAGNGPGLVNQSGLGGFIRDAGDAGDPYGAAYFKRPGQTGSVVMESGDLAKAWG